MPHADNLYSAGDSDIESFSDELSPTDGYFSNRDHPQDVMVSDPSLEPAASTADSKSREARAETATNSKSRRPLSPEVAASSPLRISSEASSTIHSPSSPTAYTPRSPTSSQRRQNDMYSETSALLHSIAPPPAYSPAAVQNFNQSYTTVPTRRLEEGISEPQSMGRPNDLNERSPLWMKQVKKLPPWRILLRKMLLVALVIVLAVGFIVAAARSVDSRKRRQDSSAGKSPSSEDDGEHGSYCSSASIHVGDSQPEFEFKSGKSLAILQVNAADKLGGISRVRTTGEIIIRPLPESSEDKETGKITFDVWLSDRAISYRVEMDAEAQALKVVSPELDDLLHGREHCLSLEITIWLPPQTKFENIVVEAAELSIRLMDDVDLHVSEGSRFATYAGDFHFPSRNLSSIQRANVESKRRPTLAQGDTEEAVAGRVKADMLDSEFSSITSSNSGQDLKGVDYSRREEFPPGFSSREIIITTRAGNIKGSFYLYDLLRLETNSGNVDVSVVPQPDPKGDKSRIAQLTVASASGYIRCKYPIWDASNIPGRDYRTSVNAHSGDVSGDYVIGTEAIFKAISGDFHINALPTTFDESTFSTDSISGSTSINVIEPLSRHLTQLSSPVDNIEMGGDDPYVIINPSEVMPIDSDEPLVLDSSYRRPLTKLTSCHEGSSGNMKIQYPSSWEGEISAATISGNIRVGGEGVRIIKDSRKNWSYREVVARKGSRAEYASALKVHEVSGSVDVWVGEQCLNSGWCKMDAI